AYPAAPLSFGPESTFATGNGPSSFVVSDVNVDGRPDLVIANYDDHSLSVLLGNGDGTFRPAPTVALGAVVDRVYTADLNGDGLPDLVASTGGTALSI